MSCVLENNSKKNQQIPKNPIFLFAYKQVTMKKTFLLAYSGVIEQNNESFYNLKQKKAVSLRKCQTPEELIDQFNHFISHRHLRRRMVRVHLRRQLQLINPAVIVSFIVTR